MNALVHFSDNLHRFFTDKHATASFELRGSRYAVTIDTPTLTSCDRRVWGDWGPMFSVDLDVAQQIVLTYRCEESGDQATYRISPPTVELNSPQSWQDREQTPLVMEFTDAARCLRFKMYLDRDGAFDRLVVRPTGPVGDAHKLLFREAQCARSSRVAN